jgi:Domain of unknown function (DUF5615)
MMRFKTDENLPLALCEILRSAGHDAASVREQSLVGRPDTDIAAVCMAEKRAIVTLDLDFSDIRTYPPGSYAGIVVLPRRCRRPRYAAEMAFPRPILSRWRRRSTHAPVVPSIQASSSRCSAKVRTRGSMPTASSWRSERSKAESAA